MKCLKTLILPALLTVAAAPAVAQLPRLLPAPSPDAVPVQLELYDGDAESKAFSEALQAAVSGDERYVIVDDLPKSGLRIIIADGLMEQRQEDMVLRSYHVVYKLGSGKFIGDDQGVCDVKRMTMCGRVVAEDAYKAYKDYITRHPPKN